MSKTIKQNGIEYHLPTVTLLKAEGLGIGELAGRTAYNSYDKSENNAIKDLAILLKEDEDYGIELDNNIARVNAIEASELLTNLAWVHHHHSVIEMCELWFFVKGTSRSVLQEHSRHRMQELTVQSTRYTMSVVLNAFIASYTIWEHISKATARASFDSLVKSNDVLILATEELHKIETISIYEKLKYQIEATKDIEFKSMLSNEGANILKENISGTVELFEKLQSCKQKRNVGDNFKHIVTDNWKVDLVFKMNLRSLKNYLKLRNSGAAYFLMRELAKEVQEATPKNYLDLIVKDN